MVFFIFFKIDCSCTVIKKHAVSRMPTKAAAATADSGRFVVEDVHGLGNLGNSCFLNALLQALASFPALRNDLLDAAATATPDAPCAAALQAALARVRSAGESVSQPAAADGSGRGGWGWWGGSRATAAANRRLWLAMQRARLIRAGQQEDAEELYTKLCEHLTDELVTASKLAATPGCGLRALLQEPAGGVDVAVGLEPRWAQWSCPRRFPWGVHFRHGLERCAPPQLWPGR